MPLLWTNGNMSWLLSMYVSFMQMSIMFHKQWRVFGSSGRTIETV